MNDKSLIIALILTMIAIGLLSSGSIFKEGPIKPKPFINR